MSSKSKDINGPDKAARTIVIKPVLKSDMKARNAEAALAEAVGLARAIKLDVIDQGILSLALPNSATFLGKGQVEKLKQTILDSKIELAIVDHALAPVQQRNLEKEWKCKVIDRTGIILEIFGERALTKEGQLQVELASLEYQKTRLVRSWTHLERQRGGFGFLGGPGESQLEIDRRLINQRLQRIKAELKLVQKTRGLQREARHRAEHPTVALVGYTNAGKSSLFNALTGAGVLAKNMLFATLDPTIRGMKLPSGREIVVSDTVGFISELPTHLIEAFRATLEEVQLADVIVHVRDCSHPETKLQREAVLDVLADLGVGQDDDRLIEALNKADLLPSDERSLLKNYAKRTTQEVGKALPLDGLRQEAHGGMAVLSAITGEGVADFIKLIEVRLAHQIVTYDIRIDLSDGAALSWLYAHGKIVDKRDTKTKSHLKVELSAADYGRYQSRFMKVAHAKSRS